MLFKQIVNMISIWFLNQKDVNVKLNFDNQLIYIRVKFTAHPNKSIFVTPPQYFKKATSPHPLNFSLNLTGEHFDHMKIQLHP